MASIEQYATSKGARRYRVRWRDDNRRDKEKAGFLRKQDAEDFAAEVRTTMRSGTYIDPRAAKATVAELGPGWLEGKTILKPSSFRPLEIAWRRYVLPEWGRRQIGSIRHSEIQNWVTTLSASGLSATTVIRVFSVLSGILEMAARDRLIAMNPAVNVRKPQKRTRRHVYLTIEQLNVLADSSRGARPLVILLGACGLRWGEAAGLRVRHINFLRKRLHIEENAVDVGGKIHVGTPKTHERREIAMPKFVADELALQVRGRGPDDLVFGDGSRHLHRADSRRGWFALSVKRAQAIDATIPRITPHDLRHTAASISVNEGANVLAVQQMLGHASAAMTLDRYADLFESHKDAHIQQLDAAWNRSVGI